MDASSMSTSIRRLVLEQSRRANVGHIGSSLSVADLIAALYSKVLNIPSPRDPDRDRFILSKGHAALALYCALHLKGWLTEAELATYCGDESRLDQMVASGQLTRQQEDALLDELDALLDRLLQRERVADQVVAAH